MCNIFKNVILQCKTFLSHLVDRLSASDTKMLLPASTPLYCTSTNAKSKICIRIAASSTKWIPLLVFVSGCLFPDTLC